MAASTSAALDWGQSVTFNFYVTDANGQPVAGAIVGGQNNLLGNVFQAPNTTDANGRTTYTVTVPSGSSNGVYSIQAFATRSGFANSLSSTRTLEVRHGCSYQVTGTDNTFPFAGGTGSFSVIAPPSCNWSVSNQNPEFISLSSASSGTGDGEVSFNVSQNSSTSLRTGSLIVGGSTVSVKQSGQPANVQISIGTDPDGLAFTVDGQTYTSRQSFSWVYGSNHTVSTTSTQTIGNNQFNFADWSDLGAQTHTVAANSSQTLSARFELQNATNVALDYSWQTRSISIYHGWGAASVTPGDGFIYILGGSVNSAKFSRFDSVSNTWTPLPNIPGNGILEGTAAALGGKIYAFGNYFDTAMRVFDIASGQWQTNRSGPYPFLTRGMSFIVTGGELYAVGGANMNLDPVPGLKKYNPATDTWTQMSDMPEPRGHGSTTLVNGKIYVAGGNASGNGIASVNIYDPQSNTWFVGTPLPQTRILATAIVVNSRIMVIGGSNGTVETRTVLEYNPISDTWRDLSPFNQGRYGAIGAFLRGKLYVIGGVDAANPNSPITNLEEGTPTAWAPILTFGQPVGTISGNRFGFIEISVSNPPNNYTPLTVTSSDSSVIDFPFTYSLQPGQTSVQITYRTGYAGGPVTITAELPDNLARMRAYKQITIQPRTPDAATQAATNISSNSALLNGTINPAGNPTNTFFEWGNDAALTNPQTTTLTDAGSGLTSVTGNFTLENLQGGRTYYYRTVATNSAGTTQGSIQSFTSQGA
jgi:N-acetylneuraminic acid mutarotase